VAQRATVPTIGGEIQRGTVCRCLPHRVQKVSGLFQGRPKINGVLQGGKGGGKSVQQTREERIIIAKYTCTQKAAAEMDEHKRGGVMKQTKKA